jgi:peroxiredoxin
MAGVVSYANHTSRIGSICELLVYFLVVSSLNRLSAQFNSVEGDANSEGSVMSADEEVKSGQWIGTASLVILALVALAVVVTLVQQNRYLKDQVGALAGGRSGRSGLSVGSTLPQVEVMAIGGRRSPLYENSHPVTVLAFLTTDCTYCERSIPQWTRLASALEGTDAAFLGVSLDSLEKTQEFVSNHGISWRVAVLDSHGEHSLPIRSVPVTAIVRRGGLLEELWLGQLDDSRTAQILSLVGVSTPSR